VVSDGGVPPVGVVEPFEVVEDRGTGLVSGSEGGPVEEFGLEGGEERFGYGVVMGVASPSHRHRDAGGSASSPEGCGCALVNTLQTPPPSSAGIMTSTNQ